jgi:purine-binding chemotaxis protein CheW
MRSASNDDGDGTGGERVTVLTFALEGNRYCVRSASIASVLGVADDGTLADADDPWNAGSITAAGERIRVVDLPRVFGSSFRTSARVDDPNLLVFTVTDRDGRYYGWLVDDVDGTRTVRPPALEPPAVGTSHVRGRLEIDGTEVVWLDEASIHG